jgi:PadR family transcriptional regulator PadR
LGRMPTHNGETDRIALLQGTLDLLILRVLLFGPCHGQGIARAIQRQSDEVFFVDHGSLYLALQRLEEGGMIGARWGISENNRKARYYSLTARGRAQLTQKTTQWNRLKKAMESILSPAPEET